MNMEFVIDILLRTALYCVLAIAFSKLYSTTKMLDLAQGAFLTLGPYVTYLFAIQLRQPLFVAIPVSILSSIALMLVINQFIYGPLRKKRIESWQMLIASLGVYVVLQNIISLIWGDNTLSFRTWPVKVGYEIWGAYITDVQIITFVSSASLLVLMWLLMEKTSVGQKIKAVSSNSELSGTLGISKDKVILWSFIMGAGITACAGILIAADTDMTPTMGFNWIIYAIVAMIIGGMGKMRYLLLGALFLACAQYLAAYCLDSKWMNATAYIILIVLLYFRPYGFSGQFLKKTEI